MLPSSASRSRFSAWPDASRILIYDADAASIPHSSNIYGLLNKFNNEGFQGQLCWLQGGFQAVWRERRDLVDTAPPSPVSDDDDDDNDKQLSNNNNNKKPNVLRTRQLPMSAFSLSSTINPPFQNTAPKTAALSCSSRANPPSLSSLPSRPACNPFFDTIRQNTELSHGITERITLRLPLRVRRRINDLPFRWLQDIARRAAPRQLSGYSDSSESEEEDTTDPADIEEGTEALAMQFYRIELAEQRRLMGVMEHHSKESGGLAADGITEASLNFPFSITAGVEKGAKNRYRNIWPFEHARVRLRQKRDLDEDDYVNASYVQPLGTRKRYIATQGPLPATFNDFWTLCWEQNVHIIVMLTREIEGAMVKCGNYWTDGTHGDIHTRLISVTGAINEMDQEEEEKGFFPPRDQAEEAIKKRRHKKAEPTTVKRVFEVVNDKYPEAGKRKVIHLQYLEWPDMNVPDDARGVLGLVRDVREAYEEVGLKGEEEEGEEVEGGAVALGLRNEWDEKTGVAKHALGKCSPVLLHCSAGVGRTGGFIAVDAVLDGVRREMGKRRRVAAKEGVEDAMDVDVELGPVEEGSVDSLLDAGLVMPIPVSASDNKAESAFGSDEAKDEEEEGLMVHVPLASTPLPLNDPMKTPMNIDVEGTDWGSELEDVWLGGGGGGDGEKEKPSTRQWAETVSDETGGGVMMPPSESSLRPSESSFRPLPHLASVVSSSSFAGPTSRSPPPSTEVSSSSGPSLISSEDSFGFGYGRRRMRGGRGGDDSSSLATSASVSGSTSALKSFPILPPPPPSTSTDVVAPGSGVLSPDLRTRSFSAPSSNLPTIAARSLAAPITHHHHHRVLGSSPLASSSTPWLSDTKKARSSSPFRKLQHQLQQKRSAPAVAASSSSMTSSSLPPPSSLSFDSVSGSGGPPSSFSPLLAPDESVGILGRRLRGGYGSSGCASPSGSTCTDAKDTSPSHFVPDTNNHSNSHNNQSHPNFRTTIVDYKEPRALHGDFSPPPLSTYEEPIWQVVQDMREQRMSLCQSLRQYVFVHAAVIEGALGIVDEEREEGRGEQESLESGAPGLKTKKVPTTTTTSHPATGAGMMKEYPSSTLMVSSSPSKGKRMASPTELLKEDKKGGLLLSKRPSVKRSRKVSPAIMGVVASASASTPSGISGGSSSSTAMMESGRTE